MARGPQHRLGWAARLFAAVVSLVRPHGAARLQARYDAAQTVADNRRHWANADMLAADASNAPGIRAILRSRARYECANNTYARGVVNTLACDLIGTGPRLQMRSGDAGADRLIEREWAAWSRAVRLAERLRLIKMAQVTDGEAFAIFKLNPAVPGPTKLDLDLFEADQVATPYPAFAAERLLDGIEFDGRGNPRFYHLLNRHPGDTLQLTFDLAYQRIPARDVLHYFRAARIGQTRGVSELTPALPLFAELRRYTLAVIAAAETAADHAGVLESTAPPDEDEDPNNIPQIEIERRFMPLLPDGYKFAQVRAEQPATGYAEFKKEIIKEIIRGLTMPYNIGAGDSSGYNYASGRLDHQTYFKAIKVERDGLIHILDRIFAGWLAVWRSGRIGLPSDIPGNDFLPPHEWFWDGQEHVDPAKEANAQAMRLENGTSTLAREFAREGLDWEEEVRQRAKEHALLLELGLAGAAGPRQVIGVDPEGNDIYGPATGSASAGASLNGAQIDAALTIMTRLKDGTLAAVAAEELLVGLGLGRKPAHAMIVATPVGRDDGEAALKFLRTLVEGLLHDENTRALVANFTDLGQVVELVGLPRNAEYAAPVLPVPATSGPLAGGEVMTHDGKVIGGMPMANPAMSQGSGIRNQESGVGDQGSGDGNGNGNGRAAAAGRMANV